MALDVTNPVVALCAEGMAIDGDADAARVLFQRAWELCRDDFDAAVAAHFVARHQPTPELTLHWNALAVDHASRVTDGRAEQLLPSLYLNLGDSHRTVGNRHDATIAAEHARAALQYVEAGGYRDSCSFKKSGRTTRPFKRFRIVWALCYSKFRITGTVHIMRILERNTCAGSNQLFQVVIIRVVDIILYIVLCCQYHITGTGIQWLNDQICHFSRCLISRRA